jgi:hypothetical protein
MGFQELYVWGDLEQMLWISVSPAAGIIGTSHWLLALPHFDLTCFLTFFKSSDGFFSPLYLTSTCSSHTHFATVSLVELEESVVTLAMW